MKLCAGCGKRYTEAQTSCPSCWSRAWVPAPETGDAVLPANPNPCPECGYLASAGMPKCPHCHKRLRPRPLELLCLLGLVGSPLAILYFVYHIARSHDYWFIACQLALAAAMPVCRRLLQGEYRTYRQMRLLLIGAAALYLLLSLIGALFGNYRMAAEMASALLFQLFGGVLVWLFLLLRSIQDYCSLGKPKEYYRTQAVFGEQTHTTKAERMGSSITRNL